MGTTLKNSIFICLFVIATVAFQQSLAQNETIEWRRFKRATSNSENKITKETEMEAFLMGEDTPLWVAWHNGDKNIHLVRYSAYAYKMKEPFSVGLAMDYLFSKQRYMNYDYHEYWIAKNGDQIRSDDISWMFTYYYHKARKLRKRLRYSNSSESCSASTGSGNSDKEKGEDGLKKIYINPLVILDMQALPSVYTGVKSSEWTKRVTYISAFWKMVNIKLNDLIKSTEVIIRIAGIVLGEKKDSFVLWTGGNKPTLNDALGRMMDSLNTPTWTNVFPKESYDFAVLMTSQSIGGESPYIPQGASKWRKPCLDEDHPIGDIVVWDNLGFMGIDGAVQELINVLGPAELEHRINLIPRTALIRGSKLRPNECAVRRVDAFLPYARCLAKPKSYFPPGKPVKSILPGQMMRKNEYCSTLGYSSLDKDAKLHSCSELRCTIGSWYSLWHSVGRALDGTKCSPSDKMVCMDGKCVRNKRTKSH